MHNFSKSNCSSYVRGSVHSSSIKWGVVVPKLLKPDQISMLRTDGYVAPIPVFSKKEATGFRCSLEDFEQSMTDESREETMATLSKFKPHLLFTWLDKICHNETLLNAIEDLIGPDLLIYSSAFFIKNSNDHAYVPWHQDSICLLYTSPSPRDVEESRMPSSA